MLPDYVSHMEKNPDSIHTHTHTHTHTQILPDYVSHVEKNPDSLLCRFFALIRVKPRKCYFLVMGNVLDSTRDIHKVSLYTVCLSASMSFDLSFFPPVSVCLSVSTSVCLSVCLFLSICLFVFVSDY
jgi:hypothetical protein